MEDAEEMLHLVTVVLAATKQLPDQSWLDPPELSEIFESRWRPNAATSLWHKMDFYLAAGSAWGATTTRESHAALTAALSMPRARYLLARLLLVSECDWLAHDPLESMEAKEVSQVTYPLTVLSQPTPSQPLILATLILMRAPRHCDFCVWENRYQLSS